MVYKKITIIAITIAIVATLVSNFVFATDYTSNDKIYDSILDMLIFIQKYSWPLMTVIFIYALYEFYVIGSELLQHKIMGQRLIIGIAIFMAIVQCLPLVYAFMTLTN
ncbi:MAG: hypothetical protein PHD15_01565 [Clostridia bacterium]|nr:hypothetical protein [Clostridia bacterium]MDD4386438.1 hypothetical protein [Clostridia bacterium]